MKTKIKNLQLFAPKWWNPLFLLFVVFVPFLGMIAGIIGGGLIGLLLGYESGLEIASKKIRKITAKLS